MSELREKRMADTGAPVVVSGAGPAGCAAAITLRRLGVPVILIDRARFPRDKVCGDVILPEAFEEVRRLGLADGELVARAHHCTGARYVSPSGREVSGEFPGGSGGDYRGRRVSETHGERNGSPQSRWLILPRLVFDAWLLDAARASGAGIREETEVSGLIRDDCGRVRGVTVRPAGAGATRSREPDSRTRQYREPDSAEAGSGDLRPGKMHSGQPPFGEPRLRTEERIEASVVVGADGASSAVARFLGEHAPNPGGVGIAVRGYAHGVRIPAPFAEIHTSAETLPGCAWIVPTGEDTCNVGVGVIRSGRRGPGRKPAELLNRLRMTLPLFGARLAGAEITGLKSWYLPFVSPGRKLCGPGWVLTGDAASLIDPLTGHGIHNAITSGRLAGETIARALATGDVSRSGLLPYEAAVNERVVRQAQRGLPVRRLHSYAFFADLLAGAGSSEGVLGRQVRDRLLALIGHTAARGPIPGLVRPLPSLASLETGP